MGLTPKEKLHALTSICTAAENLNVSARNREKSLKEHQVAISNALRVALEEAGQDDLLQKPLHKALPGLVRLREKLKRVMGK